MDYTTFTTNFPEFSDQTKYPQGQVNFYLGFGVNLLNVSAWGNLLDQGLQLFTAHNLVLAAQRQKATAAGGVPGAAQGMVSGKTVDKASVSYDTASVALEGGGDWNLTTYGLQYLRLSRIVGAQGIRQL